MSQKTLKLIAVDEHNYTRLQHLGIVPMSFNQVVGRVLDEYEEMKRKEQRQQPRLTITPKAGLGDAENKEK